MDRTEKKKTGSQQTFLAWMFCFPTSDHAMMVPPQRTVSFKFCPMHVHPRAFVCIFYDKTKIKFPGENDVV